MTLTTSTSAEADVVARGSRRFKDRDEITAAGYVPGWKPGRQPVVGEQAVIHGHGQWREAVITKVTPTLVHAVFTTPTNVKQAQERHSFDLHLDVTAESAAVERQARRNFAYYLGEVGPAPLHAKYRSEADWARIRSTVEAGVEALVADEVGRVEAARTQRRARASATDWTDYVTVTKGSGRRDGQRSDLYVRP